MYVLVEKGAVGVHDVEDLKAFHVEVEPGLTDQELDDRLRAGDYGYVRDGRAFILVSRIRESVTDVEGMADMVDYAKSKGWVDQEGEALQAHIVRA
ncbi:hypothetical protein [Rhodococcus sp. IEGM 1379]|uniref:hypothetical protein n=1 Tax=Rhodococcus sp. IEGM 1379 TaxID=3047086 RepID=UPI0024B74273|nr:hypothetical protein [Rhodococcus sp. IEGM 1379]MDI9915141.1 hypothetical protein [Rhodococcus sp. IEGM 1379]